MKLREVLSQIRTLLTPNSTIAGSELGLEPNSVTTRDTSATILDQGSSKQKFDALKAYLDQTGKIADPLLAQLVKFLSTQLESLRGSSCLNTIEINQLHLLLNQLLEVPLTHEEQLNVLRKQLSVNNQLSWKPLETNEDVGTTHEAKEKKFIPLPNKVRNGNGKTIQPLDKPSFFTINSLTGEIVLNIPIDLDRHSKGIEATKQKEALIDPEHPLVKNKVGRLIESDYLADYGVKWDQIKCIRDLFQNFSDSHGLTLEGVKIRVEKKSEKDPYVIRIEGLGEFHPEYVEKTGATTKKGKEDSAGGFGEGAKILSLVFLRDHKVDKISFSSRNWKLECILDNFVSGKKGLYRKLDIVEDRPGNYVEMVTNDANLVHALINGVDLFYHPHNTDFDNPTFENEVGGFKYLGRNAGGNVYPVRQRYEVSTKGRPQWSGGYRQLSIWTNKQVGDWTPDRDRTAIDESTISSNMIRPIIKSMSDEDLIKTIKLLEDFWTSDLDYYQQNFRRDDRISYTSLREKRTAFDPNTEGPAACMLYSLVSEAKKRNIVTKFKDNLLAIPSNDSGFPSQYLHELERAGYVFCMSTFNEIGMPKATDVWKELAKHNPLEPTENEIKQINILKGAANALRQKFLGAQFALSEGDIKKPIYIFNREERRANKDALGEYGGTHIWFDRTFLSTITFEKALAVYLHELTHKYGGDETAEFSYRITDWLDLVMKNLNDPEIKEKLDDLKCLWQEIVPEDFAQASEDVQFLSGMARSVYIPTVHHQKARLTSTPKDLEIIYNLFDKILGANSKKELGV